MSKVLLAPKPGSDLHIGTGPVTFSSPNAPQVAAGDFFVIEAEGQTPNLPDIGYLMPWEPGPWPKFLGSVQADGSFMIIGQATQAGNINDGNGIILAVGVLPPGGQFPVSPFGYHATLFQAAPPAPPPPTPGIPNLAGLVRASYQTHVPVASRPDSFDRTLEYIAAQPWLLAPQPTPLVFWTCALLDIPTAKIAAALGATVKKEAPPVIATPDLAAGYPVPLVNYLYLTINGVPQRANAGDVVQAFSVEPLEESITACFKPLTA